MGKYLKLGVQAPMKNHTFMKGTAFDTTCTQFDPPAGIAGVSYVSRTPTIYAALNKGDTVKLGASSNSDNLRATEEISVSRVLVDNGSNGFFLFDSTANLVFNYNRPDKIAGLGNHFPDSWSAPSIADINSFGGDVHYIPRLDGLNLPNYSDLVSGVDNGIIADFTTFGIDDYFSSKIALFKDGSSTSSTNLDILRYNFNTGDLLTDTYYRAGFFYKYKIYNNTGVLSVKGTATVNDGNSDIISGIYLFKIGDREDLNWSLVVTNPAKTVGSGGYINFNIELGGFPGGSPTKLLHNLDCVWLEHAKWTDGDTDGVYTFTEHPAIGSQAWNFEEFRQKSELATGVTAYGQKDGRKRARFKFACSFENVSSDFWKNLLIIRQWGQLGYKIVFHTSEDFAGRVPPILVGKIRINSVKKSSWSADLKSFTFQFEESE